MALDIAPATADNTFLTTLHTPPVTTALHQAYILPSEQTYIITCRDANLKDLVVLDSTGTNPLFTLTTKPFLTSWSARRSLHSTPTTSTTNDPHPQTHILDIRHHNSKLSEWELQSPTGSRLCLVKEAQIPGKKLTHLTATIATESTYATHTLRSSDHNGTTTIVEVEGVVVAELTMTDCNDVSFVKTRGLVRSAWRLRCAQGVDVAVVVALVVCRVEANHLWRR